MISLTSLFLPPKKLLQVCARKRVSLLDSIIGRKDSQFHISIDIFFSLVFILLYHPYIRVHGRFNDNLRLGGEAVVSRVRSTTIELKEEWQFFSLKFDDTPIGRGRERKERQVDDNLLLEGENPVTGEYNMLLLIKRKVLEHIFYVMLWFMLYK